MLEIVDRHVLAEDFACSFFTRDQGCAGEGEENRVRQRRAHVQRKRVVLRAVRFIGEDDHVAPIAEQLRRLELVNESKNVAMISAQQLAQLRAALRVTLVALVFAHRACGFERLRDLIIQFHAIGHHHERPIPRYLPQHFLREENHGEAFARALRLPENTATPVSFLPRLQHRRDRIVHAEHLMILPENLDQPALVFGEQGEIFH